MIASSGWKVGIGLFVVAGALASSGAGCGSGTSSSTGETTSTGSAGGGTSGTGGAAGTGGDTGTTSTGTMATTSSTSSTSSASSTSSTGTGMTGYADCPACTNASAGAPGNECKAANAACKADPNCMAIVNCAYDQTNGCSTDADGACCTFTCYDTLTKSLPNDAAGMAAAQKAIAEYHAYDDCVYCTTCKSQCSADAYCKGIAAGQAACPP